MESIQRSLMLLKADAPSEGRATLKLAYDGSIVSINLQVHMPAAEGCTLFVFEKSGKIHRAGMVEGGHLLSSLGIPALSDIISAAIVNEPSGGFLLKSSGMDWESALTRFRIAHMQSAASTHDSQKEYTETRAEPQKNARSIAEPTDTEPPTSQPKACSACPHVIRQDKINPFPSAFPKSEWTRISYPGPTGWWHYISGRIYHDKRLIAKVLGVPGEYGMAPPIWLEGFGTYMRCSSPDAHGYWLMFQDAQTGEVLDVGLSPRDA